MRTTRLIRFAFFALMLVVIPASSFAGVFVSVTVAPPVLPVYAQPPCPGDGYIWTPGYWAWGPDGYYWVPGTWVMAPEPGLLWTPGYWGWSTGYYVWHPGYWGPHVGFYGGVNYGFGYFGAGYAGGYWRGRTFFYNRRVTNVTITNVHIYNKTVVNNVTVHRVSYNGGAGGINVHPRPEEERAFRERRFNGTNLQAQHEHAAAGNRASWASVNHGRPEVAATPRPSEFHGRGGMPSHPQPQYRGDNHGMDRDSPHPMAHNIDRPARPQDDHSNRGAQPYNAPRPESHGRPELRPSGYHEHPNGPNAGPHSGAPGQGRGEDRGKGRDRH
ncbi:MAG TPA: YXWGXW repeat-containing protein [Terriglobales bacterium]|jgi:hypothetical protein|nr:YXWGXW repeat-containing protein [Terriglobales bacterium]